MTTRPRPDGRPHEDEERGLRRLLLAGYGVLCLVLIVGSVLLAVTVRDRDRSVRRDDELWRPGQVAARDLLGYAVDQETGQRGYLLTGDDRFLEPYALGRAGSDDRLARLTALFAGHTELLRQVEGVDAALTRWQDEAAEPEIVAARTSLESARSIVVAGNGKQLFDAFRAELQQLLDLIDSRSTDVQQQRNRAFRRVATTAEIAIGGLFLAATFTLLLSRVWIQRLGMTQQRLRSTLTTLQAGLVPQSVPRVDAAEIAVRYEPATDDLEIGGDFYDIAELDDAVLAITIGDVCGHDIEAAVLTGMVRHTINAAGAHIDDPADVLRWTNTAILRVGHDARFVSVAHARFDARSGDLRISLAGHPQPILLPGDGGPAREIGARGTVLGVKDHLAVTTVTVQLKTEDQVIFFTDGLLENSRPRLDPADLLAMVQDCRADTATQTTANLIDRYRALDLRASRDDLALVVVRSTR